MQKNCVEDQTQIQNPTELPRYVYFNGCVTPVQSVIIGPAAYHTTGTHSTVPAVYTLSLHATPLAPLCSVASPSVLTRRVPSNLGDPLSLALLVQQIPPLPKV